MNSPPRELAEACYNGACNPHGIINSRPEAIKEIPPGHCKDSVELKITLGQLSFLVGESFGPSEKVLAAYHDLVSCSCPIPGGDASSEFTAGRSAKGTDNPTGPPA